MVRSLRQRMNKSSFIVFQKQNKSHLKDMATIILDVQDESLLTQIKKACQLLKGVASVRVHKTKNEDITKTAGYKEAMDDIKHGRVYHAESVDDMFKQISQTTVTNQNTSTPSRLSRLQDAKEYMVQHGWTPLTPEEEVEFHKMVAEFTNL